MLNKNLLKEEVINYVNNNLDSDLATLRMKKSPFTQVSSLEIVQQIQGKRIAKHKFPFLFKKNEIIYPPHINLEQASSQSISEFKSKIIKGKKGIDLTGGMGIDSFFLSQSCDNFYYIEPNQNLLEITKYNFWALEIRNVEFINQKAENFLNNFNNKNLPSFDFIYLDPSRRDNHNNKKIFIEDLTPNVIELQEKLLILSSNIYIKISPLIDIQNIINQLNISSIYIIALKNEVKEILIKLDKIENKNPVLQCVNLESEQPNFSFNWLDEKEESSPFYSSPNLYLYIPNNAILKSGSFKLISNKFRLNKLHPNTHIYTSDKINHEFPGRIFKIKDYTFNIQKNKGKRYNIITKNYPLKIEEIKKKYNLNEGGNEYLFFIKSIDKNTCLLGDLIK